MKQVRESVLVASRLEWRDPEIRLDLMEEQARRALRDPSGRLVVHIAREVATGVELDLQSLGLVSAEELPAELGLDIRPERGKR